MLHSSILLAAVPLIGTPVAAARGPLAAEAVAQEAYLKASNTGTSDVFGWSVAVSGDTVVVGAWAEDSNATGVDGDQSNNATPQAGAAYVLVRDGGTWIQQAYLKAASTDSADGFGESVAISGDTIVVGCSGDDSNAVGINGDPSNDEGFNSGAAYVFVRNGTSWSQQAYLKASNAEAHDVFGYAVAISGDTIVVGAVGEDSSATGVNGNQGDNSLSGPGAAYVFVRSGGNWTQEAYLKASNPDDFDHFGASVGISGDVLAVGAWEEDSSAVGVGGNQSNDDALNSGAVYAFARSGTTWSQEAYIKASNAGVGDRFGQALALSGDVLVIGAEEERSSATGVNGDQNDNSLFSAGAAYVLVRGGGTWSQQAYLKASNTDTGDRFGYAVAVSGDVVAVGAYREDSSATGVDGDESSDDAMDSGSAYVFRRTGQDWDQIAYVKASNTDVGDWLGLSAAASDGTVVLGASNEDGSGTGANGNPSSNGTTDSGAVYVFEAGFPSAVAFRNAGVNPASYAADPIEIGLPFTALVDNGVAAQLHSRLVAFDAPTSVTLAGGQTLLCLDLGSGELFTGSNLAPTSSSGGVDSYMLAVPNDSSLAGLTFSSQALQFGNPPFVLSNAQDFTIGGL